MKHKFKVSVESEGQNSAYLLLSNKKYSETGLWIKNAAEEIPQIIEALQVYLEEYS